MIWKKIGSKKVRSERWFLHLLYFIPLDPALLADQRVLENVLRGCQGVHCILDYFSLAIQKEIKPHMRKIVTDWMLEVTEEEKCR